MPSAISSRVRKLLQKIFGQPEASVQQDISAPQIGKAGEPLRVLAFAGGGLDTIMQLGVTHALLVFKGQAPDVVAGVSGGAIQAVALAEILQAGRTATRNGVKAGE